MMSDRLSTTLNDTAVRFRDDAHDEIAVGHPESAETLLRLAAKLEQLATNHRAHAILADDWSHDPAQAAPNPVSPAALRTQRESLGLTQAQLAVRLGVSKSTVAHWEQGVQRIPDYVRLALRSIAYGWP